LSSAVSFENTLNLLGDLFRAKNAGVTVGENANEKNGYKQNNICTKF
jgi:hypothetical protein